VRAQEIARRDLTVTAFFLEDLRLGAFAGAGRTEKNEDHFLMNPR
jgi:hypothetical protein